MSDKKRPNEDAAETLEAKKARLEQEAKDVQAEIDAQKASAESNIHTFDIGDEYRIICDFIKRDEHSKAGFDLRIEATDMDPQEFAGVAVRIEKLPPKTPE